MILKYRKATPNDVEEIYDIVHTAIDAMERDNIFQWDDLYPAKEDFQEDVDKRSTLCWVSEWSNSGCIYLKSRV